MLRPCLGAAGNRCAELVSGASRCPSCTSRLNIAKGSATARGYGYAWQRISARKRRVTPWCELAYPGCRRAAADVDHRIPLRAGGRSVWRNAQSVCKPCHARKTIEDRERYPNAA